MLTITSKSRPGSPSRLPKLLAIAHATLALYLWVCAFDAKLVLTSVPLWQILSGLWLVWPAPLAVRAAVLVARFVRGTLRPNPAPRGDGPKLTFSVEPSSAPAAGLSP